MSRRHSLIYEFLSPPMGGNLQNWLWNIGAEAVHLPGALKLSAQKKIIKPPAEIVQLEFQLVNSFDAKVGKSFFFPSGCIHALALMCKHRTQGS